MSKNYIDKNEMNDELVNYKQTGVMSERLGEMFLSIANGLIRNNKSLRGYTFVEDLVADAVYRMVLKAHVYDETRPDSNPFGYFTQTAWYAAKASIPRYMKLSKVRQKYADYIWEEFSHLEGIELQREDDINFYHDSEEFD